VFIRNEQQQNGVIVMIIVSDFHLGMKKSDCDVQSEKMRQIEKAVTQGNAKIINPYEGCDNPDELKTIEKWHIKKDNT
tara:strand:- start:3154 stop:3387 length:234 start_codon:yes stop_codon:yes gene_type:complete